MAICEVTTVGLVVKSSFWLFIPIGAGGTIGCISSILFHSKMREFFDAREARDTREKRKRSQLS